MVLMIIHVYLTCRGRQSSFNFQGDSRKISCHSHGMNAFFKSLPLSYTGISNRGPILKSCDKQKTVTKATNMNNGHVSMPIRWLIRALCIVRASRTSSGSPWSTCCEISNFHHTLVQEKIKQKHDAFDPLTFEVL